MLDANQVRAELNSLIDRYPNNTGAIGTSEYGSKDCVYFLDEYGVEITRTFAEYGELNEVTLATPVCIVGHWVQEFHPELKDNPAIRAVLIRNSIISSVNNEDTNPLDPPVLEILRDYQQAQDDEKVPTWSAIPRFLNQGF